MNIGANNVIVLALFVDRACRIDIDCYRIFILVRNFIEAKHKLDAISRKKIDLVFGMEDERRVGWQDCVESPHRRNFCPDVFDSKLYGAFLSYPRFWSRNECVSCLINITGGNDTRTQIYVSIWI